MPQLLVQVWLPLKCEHADVMWGSPPCSGTAPASPVANGAYTGNCATEGAKMYSGWACKLECDDGYTVSGATRCVKGSIVETATCIECDAGGCPETNTGIPDSVANGARRAGGIMTSAACFILVAIGLRVQGL